MRLHRPFRITFFLALHLLPAGAAVIPLARPLAVEGKGDDRQTLVWINTRHWTRSALEALRDTLKAEGREPDLAGVEAALAARDHWEEGRTFPFVRAKADASGEPLLGWDAEGRDLRRGDLVPGMDLADARFLPGAPLDGLDLRAVRFDGADLEGADLRGSALARASFAQANLQGARFSEAIPLHDSRFLGALVGPAEPAASVPASVPATSVPTVPSRTSTGETLVQNGLEVRMRTFDPESLLGRPGGPGVVEEWVLDGLMAGAPRRIIPHSAGLAAVMDDGRTLLWLSRQGCEELVFPESEGPIGLVVPEQGKLRIVLEKGGRLVQVKRGEDGRLKLAGVARLNRAAVAAAMNPPGGDLGARTALLDATRPDPALAGSVDHYWCLSSFPSGGAIGLTERNVVLLQGGKERTYRYAFTWRSNPPVLLRDGSGQTFMLLEGKLQTLHFRNGTGGKEGRSRTCLPGPLAEPLPEKARVTDMCLGPERDIWFTGTGFEGLGRVGPKGRLSFHKITGEGGAVPRSVVSDGLNLYLSLADRASILVYQPFKAAAEMAQARVDERLARLNAELAAAKEEQRRIIAEVRAERRAREALVKRVEAQLEAKMADGYPAPEGRPKLLSDVDPRLGEGGSELDDMRKDVEKLEAMLLNLKEWDRNPPPPQPVEAVPSPEEEPAWEEVKGRPRFRGKAIDWNHIEAFHTARAPRFKSRFEAGLLREDIAKLIEATLAEPHVWRRSGDCWVLGRNFGRLIGRDRHWSGTEAGDSDWWRADNLMLVLDAEGTIRTAYPALSLPASGPASDRGESKEAARVPAKAKQG